MHKCEVHHTEQNSLLQAISRLPHKEITQNIKATALECEETIYYVTLACIINKSKTSTLKSSFGIYISCKLQNTGQNRKVCHFLK
jgi:hypothetical protein